MRTSPKFPLLEAKHDGGDWRITSPFGVRVDPITGAAGAAHYAVDISCYLGTGVLAPADGRVTSMQITSGGGRTLTMEDHTGVEYTFMHLHDYASGIAVNTPVKKGQMICRTGNSGARTTGAHLHFEIRAGGSLVDPIKFLGI